MSKATRPEMVARREAVLTPHTDIAPDAVKDITGALTALLADVFALYLKTKNFHWHISGPHFRDYHLLLDEQADQIFAMTDDIAERVRKIGGTTLRSIGQIARLQRVARQRRRLRHAAGHARRAARGQQAAGRCACASAHDLCDEHGDVATASLLENWIDEAERRAWFLFETTRAQRDRLIFFFFFFFFFKKKKKKIARRGPTSSRCSRRAPQPDVQPLASHRDRPASTASRRLLPHERAEPYRGAPVLPSPYLR